MKTAKQWLSDNGYTTENDHIANIMDQFLKESTEQPKPKNLCMTCGNELIGSGYCSRDCATKAFETEQPSQSKTELEILHDVKRMFMFHSDYSTQCHGYRSLLRKIEELEKEQPSQPEPKEVRYHLNCKVCGKSYWDLEAFPKDQTCPDCFHGIISQPVGEQYTHDLSKVQIGDVLVNREGDKYVVTHIDEDEAGRKRLWEDNVAFTTEAPEGHNMRTKPPYWKINPKEQTVEEVKSTEEILNMNLDYTSKESINERMDIDIWVDILNAMEAYHNQFPKVVLPSDQIEQGITRFLESLGDKENQYIIKANLHPTTRDDSWWITHSVIGSGEPLEQLLKSKLLNQ